MGVWRNSCSGGGMPAMFKKRIRKIVHVYCGGCGRWLRPRVTQSGGVELVLVPAHADPMPDLKPKPPILDW